MNEVSIIRKYFPKLSERQLELFAQLPALYEHWNAQINVISRKDTENFMERHVLHSLGIAKVHAFKDGLEILDVGTGGGFPGIPLAIMFPGCRFTLVDSIGKKIKVVREVCAALELENVEALHMRAEQVPGKFDFVVSRAVTAMPAFLEWVRKKFRDKSADTLPNGVLYLKGGDLIEEMSPVKRYYKITALSRHFDEAFFETKKVVYVKM